MGRPRSNVEARQEDVMVRPYLNVRNLLLCLLVGALALVIQYYAVLKPKPAFKLPYGYYALYGPDGKYVVVTHGGVVGDELYPLATIYDAADGSEISQLDSSATPVDAVFSPDGRYLVTAILGNELQFWETTSWQPVRNIKASALICDVDYHPDGTVLLIATCSGSGGHVAVLEANSGGELERMMSYSGPITSVRVAYSPGGKWITAAVAHFDPGETVFHVWDSETYQEIRHFDLPGTMNDFAWSPDEHFIAAVTEDGRLVVWDTSTGKRVKVLREPSSLKSVAYSPDGCCIAAGGRHPTTLWDTANWKKIGILGGGQVRSIYYSPDGDYIVITRETGRYAKTDVFKTSDTRPRDGLVGLLDRFIVRLED
jgi:WD40 repeat protein